MRYVSHLALPSLTAVVLFGVAPAPAEAPQEAANKKLVLDFYNELYKGEADGNLKDRIASVAGKYMLPEYIQHNPAFRNRCGDGGRRPRDVFTKREVPGGRWSRSGVRIHLQHVSYKGRQV